MTDHDKKPEDEEKKHGVERAPGDGPQTFEESPPPIPPSVPDPVGP